MLALIFATAAWGGLFHAGKLALSQLDPFWFTFVRYLCAAILLVGVLSWSGTIRWHLLRQNWVRLAWYGMLGYGMFAILVFVGLNRSVPSHGAVVMATIPVTTLVLRWVLDRQRPQWWAWAVVGLTIVGVIMVSGAWTANNAAGRSVVVGDLIALFGTLAWVAYTRGQGKLLNLTVVEYTAFTAMLAVPGLFLIAVFATWMGWAHIPNGEALIHVGPAMSYVVIIATVAAALAYNKGVRQLGATQGIVFINFVPVSALLISIFRGAVPGASEMIGTALVITALLIQARLMQPRPAYTADKMQPARS